MGNPENKEGFATNPDVPVTSTQSKNEASSTHGGTQRSESHYKKIVEKAINSTAKPTSKK
jgi:hypothetical protein